MQALLHAIATMPLPHDAQRIFHGRGGLYPGCEHWALDAFPPVWVLTSFQPVTDDELAVLHQALSARWQQLAPGQALNWVFQCRHASQTETRLMAGSVHEPHVVTEDGARYRVHVLKGQNHGLFLDMAEGRRWVRAHVQARTRLKVLNLFAYTCAFSVVAMQAGAPHVVSEDGARYRLHVLKGQNHGLFLDMAEGRRWVRAHVQARARLKVLNLFAYTCAFSVVAMQAGARHVVNVDMSQGAMTVGQQNHQLNGVMAGASFLVHDIFKTWGKITRGGPYDLIIVDPPSYQKGSFIATQDYAKLMRRLPDLLAPEGHALLCLNAPELDVAFLQEQMQALAPDLVFKERVANPAVFADVSPERALKVLVYQGPGIAP